MATESETRSGTLPNTLRIRLITDRVSSSVFFVTALFAGVLFVAIVLLLAERSVLVVVERSLSELLFSTNWNPDARVFGFWPAIVGTVAVTGLSMAIAIPISIFSAIYISEYATGRTKILLSSFIDVLAAVPSAVYGIFGLITVVPLISGYIAPVFGLRVPGLSILAASIIVSIMVLPYIISLSVESLDALPRELREASLSVGATKWETIRMVLLRGAGPGIFSAVLLGFGWAFGQTIAVAMVIGGQTTVPGSPFDPAQTLPSLIVLTYGEMMSIPLTQSALLFAGFLLLIVVAVFNLGAILIRRRFERRWRY